MTKQVVASVIGVLVTGAIVVGVAKFLGPLQLSISQTTTNKQGTFDVTGQGEVTTDPDRAKVSVGTQVSDDTVAKVQDKGNRVIKAVTDDVKKLGIDAADIKTVNYSLYPNYNFQTGSQKIAGYNLNVSLEITIKDFSKINQVIDAATADGANQIGGVTFTLSDQKQKSTEDQAREQAIKAAKEKADSLARLSGIRLGKIVNVTENNNQAPRPILFNAKDLAVPNAAGGTAAAPTDVQPGSTTVTLTVTLSYETL